MWRHKILNSTLARPAEFLSSTGVRRHKNISFYKFPARYRLDYQPLFGKMSPHSSPRNSGWRRLISIVGFSQSGLPPADFRLATLSQKLSYVIRVEKMNAAFERVLETFQIENLKDLRREALEKLVSGLDVFIIQPTGSGKSLNFSVSPDCVRHSKTVLKCEINRPCDFSSGFSYARPSAVPEVCWNQRLVYRPFLLLDLLLDLLRGEEISTARQHSVKF